LLVCVNAKKEEIGTLARILTRISGVKEERRSYFDEALGVGAVRTPFAVPSFAEAILSVCIWLKDERSVVVEASSKNKEAQSKSCARGMVAVEILKMLLFHKFRY
jgi:hypothetical protein